MLLYIFLRLMRDAADAADADDAVAMLAYDADAAAVYY